MNCAHDRKSVFHIAVCYGMTTCKCTACLYQICIRDRGDRVQTFVCRQCKAPRRRPLSGSTSKSPYILIPGIVFIFSINACISSCSLAYILSVSYTHLDVYKRQSLTYATLCLHARDVWIDRDSAVHNSLIIKYFNLSLIHI